MCGITGCELTGHGKATDLILVRLKKRNQRVFIQWVGFTTSMIMATHQNNAWIALQRIPKAMPIQILFTKSDIDQRDAATLPFNQCVGCKCR